MINKGAVSFNQCLFEIEKYIKFIHDQFFEVQNFKQEKDDWIHIFEKEVEELSKSWATLQEERKNLHKKKYKSGFGKAAEEFKKVSTGRNYHPRKGIINNQVNSVCGAHDITGLAERYDTLNNHTSLSVRNWNQNFSTWAITEEDRYTQILNSKNNQSLLYNGGMVRS